MAGIAFNMAGKVRNNSNITVTVDLIKKIVDWDRKNMRLKDHHFRFMWDVAEGKHPLNDRTMKFALMNLKTLKKYGFNE
jgi:hypothetical protein